MLSPGHMKVIDKQGITKKVVASSRPVRYDKHMTTTQAPTAAALVQAYRDATRTGASDADLYRIQQMSNDSGVNLATIGEWSRKAGE